MIPQVDTPIRTDDLIYETCSTCKGEGIIDKDVPDENVGWVVKLVTCENCEGSRKIIREYEPEMEE